MWEDDERRHRRGARSSTASQSRRSGDRGGAIQPERNLRGNGRGRHPLADRVRRRRVQIDRRGEDVEQRGVARHATDCVHPWTREIRTWSTWPRWGMYGPHPDRGVFRSTDGGRTWSKVLDRGNETGAVDLAFDPADSQTIYATVWNAAPGVEHVCSAGRRGQRAVSHDRWRRSLDADRGTGCPNRSGGAAAWRGGRQARLRADRCGGRRGGTVPLRRRRRDVGAPPAMRGLPAATVFLRDHNHPKNADVVYVPNVALYRSTDGGRNFTAFKASARRRRLPHPVDRPD